jgi:hypothetical protein
MKGHARNALGTALGWLACFAVPAGQAGPMSVLNPPGASTASGVQVYFDIDEFRAAAAEVGTGVVHEIDFGILPDGTPAPTGGASVQITPDFNYTVHGVTFSSHQPELIVLGHASGGGTLLANSESGIRNWIEVTFSPQVFAVAITAGPPIFTIFDGKGRVLAESVFESEFVGFVSEVPVGIARVDQNSNSASMSRMLFQPIPEPATILMIVLGGVFVISPSRGKGL